MTPPTSASTPSKTPKHLVSVDELATLDCVSAVVKFGYLFRRQLDYFIRLYGLVLHDISNDTSAGFACCFARSRVSHRFVIFSTTVFWRRRARRFVKSTESRGWS